MKMPAVLLCTAGALAVLSAAGCGGSSSSGTSAPTLTPRSVSTVLSNGLTATLTEDRSTVAIGGTVTYTATLTNKTTQPITFGYAVGPNSIDPSQAVPANLTVSNPSGQNVSPPAGFAQIGIFTPNFTLAPGQTLSGSRSDITTTSYNFVEGYTIAGEYTATATFEVVPLSSTDTSLSIQATTGPLTVTAQ